MPTKSKIRVGKLITVGIILLLGYSWYGSFPDFHIGFDSNGSEVRKYRMVVQTQPVNGQLAAYDLRRWWLRNGIQQGQSLGRLATWHAEVTVLRGETVSAHGQVVDSAVNLHFKCTIFKLPSNKIIIENENYSTNRIDCIAMAR